MFTMFTNLVHYVSMLNLNILVLLNWLQQYYILFYFFYIILYSYTLAAALF